MHQQSTTPRKRYRTVPRTCEYCGAPFHAYPYEVRRGQGRFCSRSCGKRRGLADAAQRHIGAPTASGCRPWLGARDQDGYGKLTTDYIQRRATHAVWYLRTGHWPAPGEVIAHTCDWPPCVEWTHLWLTDNAGNMADCQAKQRQAYGARAGAAKLTESDVREIRRLYYGEGISTPKIAARLGIPVPTVGDIVRFHTWKHVR